MERLHAAVDHGDRVAARRLLRALSAGEVPASEIALARYRVLSLDEDLEPALAAAKEGLDLEPDSADLQHAVGFTLLSLGRAEDAIPFLEEACYLDRDLADAWHDLAIAREETGDIQGMRLAFEEVWELDFAEPLPPLRFDPSKVSGWAERAFQLMPDAVRTAAANVAVFVDDHPERWIVQDHPWDPRLLGLFDGPTWAEERSGASAGRKAHVYLYHRNLERHCPDAPTMAEQIRVTVFHELGHYLGLGEEDLERRGLD